VTQSLSEFVLLMSIFSFFTGPIRSSKRLLAKKPIVLKEISCDELETDSDTLSSTRSYETVVSNSDSEEQPKYANAREKKS